jgi:hypothetical protein
LKQNNGNYLFETRCKWEKIWRGKIPLDILRGLKHKISNYTEKREKYVA